VGYDANTYMQTQHLLFPEIVGGGKAELKLVAQSVRTDILHWSPS
jgi:hypothetical protein